MEIQHVAQFSAGVEFPRVIASNNSDRRSNSVEQAKVLEGREAVRRYPLLLASLLALGALYLLQVASPLRLESDAVDYLRTAAALEDGRALPTVPFPPGYPIIIAALDRAGLGSVLYFVLANCLFLGLGLWATWSLHQERPARVRLWILAATLLAIPVVKSVAAPLPEAAFFGASLVALASATSAGSAHGMKRLILFVLSFAAAVVAVSIRSVGVALIPALLWACLIAADNSGTIRASRGLRATVTILLMVSVAATVTVLLTTSTLDKYLQHPRFWYVHGGLGIPKRIYGMLTGFGQLIVNVPLSRFHGLAPVFAASGLLAASLLILAREHPLRFQIADIYLAFYLMVLAFWPYDSPRLWMPVASLIAAHVVTAIARVRNNNTSRVLVRLYAVWFTLTGIVALVYTTRISLSGENFARRYGRNGGMATAALHTLSPQQIESYNAQADTILDRYGAGRGGRPPSGRY
jgi:hypothetical protein